MLGQPTCKDLSLGALVGELVGGYHLNNHGFPRTATDMQESLYRVRRCERKRIRHRMIAMR